MKMNESAALEGTAALQLYVSCLAAALGELTVQAGLLRDATNNLAAAVVDGSQGNAMTQRR